ncbi:MAG: hypothetical protein VX745_09330 [Pseudomonadota bacterium]|nr:hypothetical protein [Pseudomonadota bacterium]
MADRYVTRCSGVLAAIVMSVALMLLSTQECLIELYMFHLIFGAMANAVCSRPPFTNDGFWFQRNPDLALGITAAVATMPSAKVLSKSARFCTILTAWGAGSRKVISNCLTSSLWQDAHTSFPSIAES